MNTSDATPSAVLLFASSISNFFFMSVNSFNANTETIKERNSKIKENAKS